MMENEQIFSKKDVDVRLTISDQELVLEFDDGSTIDYLPIEVNGRINPIETLLENWKEDGQSPEEDIRRRFNKKIDDLEDIISEFKKHRSTYPYDQHARKKVETTFDDLKRTTETLEKLSTEAKDE